MQRQQSGDVFKKEQRGEQGNKPGKEDSFPGGRGGDSVQKAGSRVGTDGDKQEQQRIFYVCRHIKTIAGCKQEQIAELDGANPV